LLENSVWWLGRGSESLEDWKINLNHGSIDEGTQGKSLVYPGEEK